MIRLWIEWKWCYGLEISEKCHINARHPGEFWTSWPQRQCWRQGVPHYVWLEWASDKVYRHPRNRHILCDHQWRQRSSICREQNTFKPSCAAAGGTAHTVFQQPAQPLPQQATPNYQALYDTAYGQIREIYQLADREINWRQILISGPATDADDEQTAYYKSLAQDVINGDIETYLKLVSDLNPLNDLMEYGSEFECGTDDPRMIGVHFTVNSQRVLAPVRALPREQYNSLLQDYVCGCAIRIARDMFSLLPVRHILVEASDGNDDILSVDFTRTAFFGLDFDTLDPSDTVQSFEYRMEYSAAKGFSPVETLDP